MQIHWLVPVAAWCASLGLAGCSGGGGQDKWKANRPEVAPVAGVVVHNGEPLENATIVLAPAASGHAASGVSDAKGRFTLAAFHPDPGAVPGQYRVSVVKQELDVAAGSPGLDEYGNPLPPPVRSVIPERYADPAKSGLVADVPAEGTSDLRFELHD